MSEDDEAAESEQSWAALFERAATHEASVAAIRDALAERRDGR